MIATKANIMRSSNDLEMKLSQPVTPLTSRESERGGWTRIRRGRLLRGLPLRGFLPPILGGLLGFHAELQAQTGGLPREEGIRGAASAMALVAPVITQGISDTTALAGEKIALRIKAAGSKPLGYQWSKDGVPIPGQNRATLALSALTAADTGVYSITVSGPGGSPVSATARLEVMVPQLSLGLEAESMMVQQGVTAPIKVEVGRTPGYKKTAKLSVSGLPSGVTGSFAPSSLGATSGSSVLRISASGTAVPGAHLVSIRVAAPGAAPAEASFRLDITQSASASEIARFTTVQPWGSETAVQMETTNAGVYVRTEKADGTHVVWRGSSQWTHWDFDEFLYSWRPSNLYNEAPAEFNVAWVGTDHFGSAIMNTGVPPLTFVSDIMGSNSNLPVVWMNDYLPGSKDWAISGQGGIFFDSSNGGDKASTMFDYVDQIQDANVALRDPNEENLTLYVGGLETLYQVDPFQTKEYKLTSLGANLYVNKLEYAAGRLWIGYGGKILTLKDGVLSQFADASTATSFFGLDSFCIANGRVYASNGLRYPLEGGPGVSWLVRNSAGLRPGSPEFDRYYRELLPILPGAQLYALKNSVSSPIYTLYGNRLYIIDPL